MENTETVLTILPTGDCFTEAAEYVDELAKIGKLTPDHYVVHAICRVDDQPELGWFSHGWVECGDRVFFAGVFGEGPLKGTKQWISADKESFYVGMHIQHIRRYSMAEVAEWNWRTKHLGPWEAPYTEHTRQAKTQQQQKGTTFENVKSDQENPS